MAQHRLAVRIIRAEKVMHVGGVTSVMADLLNSSLAGNELEGLGSGGAPVPDAIVGDVGKRFSKSAL